MKCPFKRNVIRGNTISKVEFGDCEKERCMAYAKHVCANGDICHDCKMVGIYIGKLFGDDDNGN